MTDSDFLDELKEDFYQEVPALLFECEQNLLVLEKDLLNDEAVDSLFRAIHAIKGLSATLVFDRITRLAHEMENLLYFIREKTLASSLGLIDALFQGLDCIQKLVSARKESTELSPDYEQSCLEKLRDMSRQNDYVSNFHPHQEVFDTTPLTQDSPPVLTTQNLDTTTPLPPLPSPTQDNETPPTAPIPNPDTPQPTTQSTQSSRIYMIEVEFVARDDWHSFHETFRAHGEVLWLCPAFEQRADVSGAFVFSSTHTKAHLQQLSNQLTSIRALRITELCTSMQDKSTEKDSDKSEGTETHIRYDVKIENEQVDEILNVIGEMIIQKVSLIKLNILNEEMFSRFFQLYLKFQSKIRRFRNKVNYYMDSLSDLFHENIQKDELHKLGIHSKKEEFWRMSESLGSMLDPFLEEYKVLRERLKSVSERISDLVESLQGNVTHMRMLPINHIFSRLPRLVRDVSKAFDKEVELKLTGTDTKLDKHVIQELLDPLVHIVRNAVDHGLETLEERRAQGKNEKGQLSISADYEGNAATITISDDGRGIDLDTIYQKAITMKIISQDQTLNDQEITNIIFQHGFTTKASATHTSGRGVGLDLVRRRIENLSGSIVVKTQHTKGSTFIIKVPLTLAIVRVLFAQLSTMVYAVPLDFVLETMQVPAEHIQLVDGVETIRVRDESVPVCYLHRFFQGIPRGDQFYAIIVVFRGRRLALLVDDLLDERDIVVKPLDAHYALAKGISGATILEDGRVSLIIDVASVFVAGMSIED